MTSDKIKVGITLGDMNGIGPEIVLKALADNRIVQSFTPILYGSNRVLNFYKNSLKEVEMSFQGIKEADKCIHKKVNVISISKEEIKVEPGKITKLAGSLAFKSLELAVKDLASNKIDVLVTSPINKKNIQSDKFNFLVTLSTSLNIQMLMMHSC